MRSSCVVVDYGLGNVFSVLQSLRATDVDAVLSADPRQIREADRVILPGVGAFGRAADRLRALSLDGPILEFIATGRPFLGICVGMQLLMEIGNEFGTYRGLGIVPGSVDQIEVFDAGGRKLRVPLIGWHPLSPPEGKPDAFGGTILDGLAPDAAYYFVHSFAARLVDSSALLAVTRQGTAEVTAAIHVDNVIGTQFHPERSADAGRAFLQAFMRL